MKFPFSEKTITEFGLDESHLSALYCTFQEFFNNDYVTIEHYYKNHKTEQYWCYEKLTYDQNGFIEKKQQFYDSGEISEQYFFERNENEILTKKQLPKPFGFNVTNWKFSSFGFVEKIFFNSTEEYAFCYDKNQRLSKTSEGFFFKWGEHFIEEFWTNYSSDFRKIIKKTADETQIQVTGIKNPNTPGILTFQYDKKGRMVKSADKKFTTYQEHQNENDKTEIATTFFLGEQVSMYKTIERKISEKKIEKIYIFQQRSDGPLMESRSVFTKK